MYKRGDGVGKANDSPLTECPSGQSLGGGGNTAAYCEGVGRRLGGESVSDSQVCCIVLRCVAVCCGVFVKWCRRLGGGSASYL